LKKHDELYKVYKGTLVVYNIIMGKPYVLPAGNTAIKCEKTGVMGNIHYKKRGWR